MADNALWWVRYKDPQHPNQGTQLLSLSSPDLKNPLKANRRARETAVARLAKRGVKAVVVSVQCVG